MLGWRCRGSVFKTRELRTTGTPNDADIIDDVLKDKKNDDHHQRAEKNALYDVKCTLYSSETTGNWRPNPSETTGNWRPNPSETTGDSRAEEKDFPQKLREKERAKVLFPSETTGKREGTVSAFSDALFRLSPQKLREGSLQFPSETMGRRATGAFATLRPSLP